MPKVYIRFPKTGLGNMLLVWANALLFSKLNDLPLVTGSWWGFRWGALLRAERRKRLYYGYFVESSIRDRVGANIFYALGNNIRNPVVSELTTGTKTDDRLYVFDEVITHEQLFFNLEPHRDFIKKNLLSIVHPRIITELNNFPAPVIGVHIRRGDFKLANQTTSMNFFINAINSCREVAGEELPVTIFTDAEIGELTDILKLPSVTISEPKTDIADILLLSKSRIIILSQSSTFSYWAAFLSDATVILKHDDWQERIKQNMENYHEVRFNNELPAGNLSLLQELNKIRDRSLEPEG